MSELTTDPGATWSGSHRFEARTMVHPVTTDDVVGLMRRGLPVRAVGTKHSFTDVADSPGTLVSLDRFDAPPVIDDTARTVTVGAGTRYGDLAPGLHEAGWALANLASLPHIGIAGAVATGTHGSGDRNGTLATSVAALELVDGTGLVRTLRRGDPDHAGAVVGLGCLGITTRVTLDIEPAYEVRQTAYNGLPWEALADLDAVTGAAYSVSLFTVWDEPTISSVWLKQRGDDPAPGTFHGATRQTADQHPAPGESPESTSRQCDVPGPWWDRLPHFALAFTPSSGDELQSEYLLPREAAVEAVMAIRGLAPQIRPALIVSEIRTMAGDEMWLSPAYGRDSVGIHLTWRPEPERVRALLPLIEERLLPLGARPHWAKVFAAGPDDIARAYPRLGDFLALRDAYDPDRIFSNAWTQRVLRG